MQAFSYLVAALLLAAPPGALDGWSGPWLYSLCGPAVRELAVAGEVLDPRELSHLLANPRDFTADLKVLQVRLRELAGAPYLEECARFPERGLVNDLLAFNRAYQQDLAGRLELDRIHGEDLQTALKENEDLFLIWDAVREARCEYYYVTIRRQALQHLRDLVGMETFYSGRLPPHVPVWRLPEY